MTLQEYHIEADRLVAKITKLKIKLSEHNQKFCRLCEKEFEKKWGIKRGDDIEFFGQKAKDTRIAPMGTEYHLACIYGGIVIYTNTEDPYICLKKRKSATEYKRGCNGNNNRRYVPMSDVKDIIKRNVIKANRKK